MEPPAPPPPRWGSAWVPCMLSLADVNRLRKSAAQPDQFFLAGRPIRRVAIMGDVVWLAVKAANTEYLLDDGTGLLLCVEWPGEAGLAGLPPVELGQLVEVVGRLSEYRGATQVLVNTRVRQTDPNAEWCRWAEQLRLRKQVYLKRRDADPSLEG